MKILNKLFYILPPSYIIFVLYTRIFVVKPMRDVSLLMTDFKLIITIIVIIGLIIRLRSLLLKYGYIRKKRKIKYFLPITQAFTVLMVWFSNIWISFFNLLLEKFFIINLWFFALMRYIVKQKSRKALILGILLLDYLPRLILILLFLSEIFIYKQLNYFYKASFLFLLPLSFNLLEKMLLAFHAENAPASVNNIELVTVNGREFYKMRDCYLLPDFAKNMTDYMQNFHYPLMFVMIEFVYIKEDLEKYLFDIIFIMLYLLGWHAILYLGFIKFLF